jgi:hypothetical protein
MPIKDVIVKAAMKRGVPAVFVANKKIGVPRSPYLSAVRIGTEPDEADAYIVEHAAGGDFAVSQDIPLAAELVPRGVTVIDPHGHLYTEENVRERLSIRDFMQELRDSGGTTPGPKPFSRKDVQRFADAFDRELTRHLGNAGKNGS